MYYNIEDRSYYFYHNGGRLVDYPHILIHRYSFRTESEVIKYVRDRLYEIYKCDLSMHTKIIGPGVNSNTIYVRSWFKENICFDISDIAITPIKERDY